MGQKVAFYNAFFEYESFIWNGRDAGIGIKLRIDSDALISEYVNVMKLGYFNLRFYMLQNFS